MIESELWPALRDYWHPVALTKDVREKPRAVRLLHERLALFCIGKQFVCFRDLCVHRGTPLSLGWVDGDRVVCAYHGWNYDRHGVCVCIPSLPADRPIPNKARVESFRCEERYGLIWVCLGRPRVEIPEFPEYSDPGYDGYFIGPTTWRCSAARAMENFVDQAHFPWVHEGILGDRQHTEFIPVNVQRHGDELRYTMDDRPNPMHPMKHRRVYRMHRPFTIHQRKERENGEVEVAYYTNTPHSPGDSTSFLYVTRNFRLNPEEKSKRFDLDVFVMQQDKVIVENQRPEELPLDLTVELHLKGPDAVAIEYRRFMAELGVQ
jgi:phenylpropionate dioxygenase-like ring-hydroxylating dioxygenase large terminal subunit